MSLGQVRVMGGKGFEPEKSAELRLGCSECSRQSSEVWSLSRKAEQEAERKQG